MSIHKAKSHIEVYRLKSAAEDINELSGRTGQPELTRFVAGRILSKLPLDDGTVLVDVGCGDGTLLRKAAETGANGQRGRLIGILPNQEEVARVRTHLLDDQNVRLPISIEMGTASETRLPDGLADVIVCNGVFLILGGVENVKATIDEFCRIAGKGAHIFIGEVPDSDELAGRTYGDSVVGWLYWVWKHQGFGQFWVRLKQTSDALIGSSPLVISPKTIFHMPPNEFIAMLKRHGLEVVEHYKHQGLDAEGNIVESGTRWDYLAVKTLPAPPSSVAAGKAAEVG